MFLLCLICLTELWYVFQFFFQFFQYLLTNIAYIIFFTLIFNSLVIIYSENVFLTSSHYV